MDTGKKEECRIKNVECYQIRRSFIIHHLQFTIPF